VRRWAAPFAAALLVAAAAGWWQSHEASTTGPTGPAEPERAAGTGRAPRAFSRSALPGAPGGGATPLDGENDPATGDSRLAGTDAGGAPGAGAAGLVVNGRVVDGSKPVPGATVHLGAKTLAAGADGRFSVSIPRAWRALWATSDGRASRVLQVSAAAPPRGEVVLALAGAAARLKAAVRESGTREPVAGARVECSELAVEATSDSAGSVELGGLPPGPLALRVKAEGFADTPFSVVLEPGRTTDAVLWLQRAFAISGAVVDRRGEGLPSAEVVLYRVAGGSEPVASTRTDARGRFELGELLPQAYLVDAALDGYSPGRTAAQAPASGVVVLLELGAQLEGTVTDEKGRPVAGATVRAGAAEGQSAPAARSRKQETQTGADGTYVLPGLLAGTFFVHARTPRTAESYGGYVKLAEGERKRVDITVKLESGVVSGRATDALTGAPVADARVIIETDDDDECIASTDAAGALFCAGLPEGVAHVTIVAEGYVTAKRDVQVDGPALTVALERRRWVTGRAVDSAGLPIARFTVDGDDYNELDGRFMAAPDDRDTELVISAPGRVTVRRPLGAGAQDLGDVALADALELGVQVLDTDGTPAAGAHVYSTADLTTPVREQLSRNRVAPAGVTDTAGLATVRVESSPPCLFAARPPGAASSLAACPMALRPGGAPIVLRLEDGAAIVGRVTERGAPRAGVLVGEDGSSGTAATGADGTFRIDGLSAGERQVMVAVEQTGSGTPRMFGRKVTLAAGEELRADFELEGPTALDVDVESPAEGPVRVLVLQAGGSFSLRELRVGEGRTGVHLGGLQPGTARLQCHWSFRPPPPGQVLVLQAGKPNRAQVTLPEY